MTPPPLWTLSQFGTFFFGRLPLVTVLAMVTILGMGTVLRIRYLYPILGWPQGTDVPIYIFFEVVFIFEVIFTFDDLFISNVVFVSEVVSSF